MLKRWREERLCVLYALVNLTARKHLFNFVSLYKKPYFQTDVCLSLNFKLTQYHQRNYIYLENRKKLIRCAQTIICSLFITNAELINEL